MKPFPDYRNNCLFMFVRTKLMAHPMWNVVARWFATFITGNPNAWLKR